MPLCSVASNSYAIGGGRELVGRRKINVDPGVLFAVGTLASWAGWAAVIRAVYVLLRRFFGQEPEGSTGTFRSLTLSLVVAVLGFAVASSLLPTSDAQGWRLPVVWLVMPFAAWAAVASFGWAIARLMQGFMALNRGEAQTRIKTGVLWLIAGGLFFWLFSTSGDKVEILRGSIELSPQSALWIALALIASMAAMVWTVRSVRVKDLAKGFANHLALLVGSVLFGLPFAWLVITSFKEDVDMSSATGLVWIPRVTQQVPYFDPNEVHVEGTYDGRLVEGIVVEKLPDGAAKVEIWKPAVLRGLTFTAPPGYKPVPKMVDVVTGQMSGQPVTGKVIKEMEDGRKRVQVLEPPALAGRTFEAKPDEVKKVRHVGLKYQNYPEALDYLPPETLRGLVYLKNTLIIVILNVIGTLLSSSIVAYAFARMRFPGKNMLFLLLLSTMMLPAAVTLLPTFLIYRWLGWVDTLRPLWVAAFLGSAFNIFLLRQFFMTIPLELEDAAKIDGCSFPRTFWQVMLPQVKPALAVVAIWTFMASWNNFMGPLIYINSPENMPISYAVQLFQGDRANEPGLLMAFATMAMLPVLLVFFFAQKYFIEGVTLSGMGGR